ncbi:MAG TPA: trypsin-like peptidase domain-containing protein [Reyranella sp.]|nr:trypsin-like peptidase domain-containing protein [Reyranella sp.]
MRLIAVVLVALSACLVTGGAEAQPASNPQILAPPTLAPLVRRVAPSVVSIAIKGRVAMEQNPLFNDPIFRQFFDIPQGPIEREIQAVGSGVIVNGREGLIVTNYHVIEHADEIAVTLADGRRLRGRLVGGSRAADLAVVQVAASNLVAIPLGNADTLQVGDYVIAIGNPFGIGQTVTHGIISATHRSGLENGRENYLQTDAAINPGNSGGALVDLEGNLVGINSAIIGPSGANVGIGFAIPVNTVRRFLGELVAGRGGERRRL